jgi:hypothetical protein
MFANIETDNRGPNTRSFLLILVTTLLGYLPYAHQWGFYRDDWHVLWGQNAIGFGNIFVQHQIDRPLMGLVYMFTSRILGNHAIAWALFSISLRLAGGIIAFLIFQKIFARAGWINTLMACLFVVYPGFLQVPNGNSYHLHLLAFAAGLFSLYLTLIYRDAPKPLIRAFLFLVSSLSGLLSYGMIEWMIGFELVRLILIAFRQSPRPRFSGVLLKNILQRSWLNLLVMLAFLIWRVFFFESTRSATNITQLLQGYLAAPLQSTLTIGVEFFKDLLDATFLSWGVPLYQLSLNAAYTQLLLACFLAALVVLSMKFGLPSNTPESDSPPQWTRTAIWIGGLSTLACLLPTVAVGRHIIFRDGLERYTLLASFGVIPFLTGLLVSAIKETKWQKFLLAALLASAIIVQNLNGAAFARFWETQRQLWWQLSWRIPDMQDGAALIINMPAFAPFAEDYEVWGPANLIYRPDMAQVTIAGGTFSKETIQKLMFGSKFGRTLRNIEYAGDMRNAVVVTFPPGSCVHVMDPAMPFYSLNEDLDSWMAASQSNPSMIRKSSAAHTPPQDIFGKEPPRDWCYYYQKITQAVQFEDWPQAAQYADEARADGFQPIDPSEWMPVYVTYAKTGNMEQADQLAAILRSEPGLVENYCAALLRKTSSTTEFYVYNLCPEMSFDQ